MKDEGLREKAIKGLECCGDTMNCNECPYDSEMGGCFRNLKADALKLMKDQPEVIRCKDCKHCEYPKSEKEWCKKGHLHGNAETWFCADGERR